MQKKVGNVVIDDTWYPGEDLYTDGEIEDRMLCLAQQYGDIDYSEVIAREKSWPILYHFSISGKISLSWLPMGKRMRCWKSDPAAVPLPERWRQKPHRWTVSNCP